MIDAVTHAVGLGSKVYALRHLALTDDEWRRIAALDELGDLPRAVHSITHLHRKLGRAA